MSEKKCKKCNNKKVSVHCNLNLCLKCCIKEKKDCNYKNHIIEKKYNKIINKQKEFKQNEFKQKEFKEKQFNREKQFNECINSYLDKRYINDCFERQYNLLSPISIKKIKEPYILNCYHILNKEDCYILYNNKEHESYLFECPICKIKVYYFGFFIEMFEFLNKKKEEKEINEIFNEINSIINDNDNNNDYEIKEIKGSKKENLIIASFNKNNIIIKELKEITLIS